MKYNKLSIVSISSTLLLILLFLLTAFNFFAKTNFGMQLIYLIVVVLPTISFFGGIFSLHQIKKNPQKGKIFAWISILPAVIILLSIFLTAIFGGECGLAAKCKGYDAAIKSNLANTRTQAEILYNNNMPKSYAGLCTNTNVLAQMVAAQKASKAKTIISVLEIEGSATTVTCHVSVTNDAWAIEAPLKSNTANGWCVDSLGASRQITLAHLPANATVCPVISL